MSRTRVILLALVGIALALVGGIFISNNLRRSLAPPPTPTPPPPLTERVVVTTHDLALGAVLSESDVKEIEVPLGIAPRGTLKQASTAIGRMLKANLINGEMVMTHHLADPTNLNRDLAFVLQDDQVLMAFPADDLMSQLDMLKRGDLVDILVSIDIQVKPASANPLVPQGTVEPETKTFTFDALQRIEISAVVVEVVSQQRNQEQPLIEQQGTPQPTPTPRPEDLTPVGILLALDPQDALVLKHLKDTGAIVDIVLRSPTSKQLFELEPVMPEYLVDSYKLEFEK